MPSTGWQECKRRKPGHCIWCGKKLVGKQQKYCSKQHLWEWRRNHWYSKSKEWVLKHHAYYRCATCGHGYRRADIEVNHITPADGTHAKASCKHHVDNLEILCKSCHAAVTAEQAKKRRKK